MGYRLTLDSWKRLNIINEKYHIECFEISDMDDLFDFFYKCSEIDLEKEDMDYINKLIDTMKAVDIY